MSAAARAVISHPSEPTLAIFAGRETPMCNTVSIDRVQVLQAIVHGTSKTGQAFPSINASILGQPLS